MSVYKINFFFILLLFFLLECDVKSSSMTNSSSAEGTVLVPIDVSGEIAANFLGAKKMTNNTMFLDYRMSLENVAGNNLSDAYIEYSFGYKSTPRDMFFKN